MVIVGIDSTPLRNPLTGGGRYALNIVRHFAEQPGVTLHFYGRKPDPSVTDEFSNVPLFEQTQSNMMWYGIRLPALLKRNQCMGYWGFPLPFRRVQGTVYVTSILDLYFLKLPHVEQWSRMKRLITLRHRLLSYFATWQTLKTADHVLTLSKATQEDLRHYFHNGVSDIVPPAPDITLSTPAQSSSVPDIPYILAVGGFQPYRNRERLIRSFALALSQHKCSMRLIIAGNFESVQQRMCYEALCRELKVDSHVEFFTGATDGQLAMLYRHAHGVIHPTLCEGFGMPVVEALAFGKPIVVSTAGAVPEAAGGLELMQFNPLDIEEMAESISLLFHVSVATPDEIRARTEYAQSFSWSAAGDATARRLINTI